MVVVVGECTWASGAGPAARARTLEMEGLWIGEEVGGRLPVCRQNQASRPFLGHDTVPT